MAKTIKREEMVPENHVCVSAHPFWGKAQGYIVASKTPGVVRFGVHWTATMPIYKAMYNEYDIEEDALEDCSFKFGWDGEWMKYVPTNLS